MDIDLLSKMVKDLVMDNDSVTLPGMGSFVAELVGASFSDKGYTLNPPYRRLYFTQREGNDTLLADLLSRTASIPADKASAELAEFISGLKDVLRSRKTVPMPGLGRLRATRENNFFFISDEDLDIYPEGIGLAPVSMKTHVETREEVSAALDSLSGIISVEPKPAPEQTSEPATEKAPEPAPAPTPEPAPAPTSEPASEPTNLPAPEPTPAPEPPQPEEVPVPKKRAWRTILVVLFSTIAAAALALIVFIAAARLFPDWADSVLYTPEELEILNYNNPKP